MGEFELRFSDKNDIMGDWRDVNNPDAVEEMIFGHSKYLRLVRYEYKNGSVIEYRRKEK